MRYLFETYVHNTRGENSDGFLLADDAGMRGSCTWFVTTQVRQIRHRLPDNITVLKKASLSRVENTLCIMKDALVPLLEGITVPRKQSKKWKTGGTNSPSPTVGQYRPCSRYGAKDAYGKNRAPSWPDLACR
ncbi:hypothetical protein HPB48_027044 [Haemaphysalis longicornis]|uniref:Uncharacterized protein n=1 Tax=Haemaphysalis longicornis TaxID=44386 RepID=A0A9J6HDP7_HAELO|nr:hypothetical protein HPB48_027044 [Haemaphysalis longicornis]